MGKILNTALIGLGRIAWDLHLPELCARNDQFRVTAVVDPLPERGKDVCEKFRVPKWYDSVDSLLRSEKPDLAVVCSPTIFHAQQTVALLNAGIHVFCDKPAALNVTEADSMFEAARKAGKKLMIYQPRRIFPNTFAIREILASGKLGKIYQMKLFAGDYSRRNDWQAFRKNGGGMLLNYGAHYVDQLMYLLGEDLEVLSCTTACIATLGDAEDVVKINLRGKKSGILADLDINQAASWVPYFWLICGSCGSAYLPKDGEWHLRYFDPASLPSADVQKSLAAAGRKYPETKICFTEEIFHPKAVPPSEKMYYDNVYGLLAGENTEPIVPPEETLALMKILAECRVLADR